jgi:hypothetical protein
VAISVTSFAVSIKLLVVRVVSVVVSATMVNLLSDVMSVAMISVLFSHHSGYTERPRHHFSLDVLLAFHLCLLLSYSFLKHQSFLGAFAKLLKATISFIMFVRPSVSLSVRTEQLGSHCKDFHES